MDISKIQYDLGQKPTLIDIKLKDFMVDESYQRTPSYAGIRLIKKMVNKWDWRLFKPPIVVKSISDGNENFMVVDGQHTIIAALTRGDIESIPVLLFNETSTQSQAISFVGHNTERTKVAAARLFYSKVEAGDENCIEIKNFMEDLGIYFVDTYKYELGEIASPNYFISLYNKLTMIQMQTIIQICLNAKLAPIFRGHLSLAKSAIWDNSFGEITTMEVVTALAEMKKEGVAFTSGLHLLEKEFSVKIKQIRNG